MISSYLVLIATSITCSILGVFLVLRKMSMIADAISHSVLLGIVVAFFLTQDLSSPMLIVGAGVFGVITVALIETIGKSKTVMRNDAIGVVFPMFFALAVILISRYAKNVHIDTDVVLTGEVVFASLETIRILGLEVPNSLIKILIVLAVNLAFVSVFFKQLKITAFDEEFAYLIGIPIGLIFYSFMTLTSITAVVAFDAVGSILVLSFFISPAATAYLLAKDLKAMLLLSGVISAINCSIGSLIAIKYNASMSGMCAVTGMVIFIIAIVFNKNGVIVNIIKHRNRNKKSQHSI